MNCIYKMKVKSLGKKATKVVNNLLHNKYVLYLMLFFAITNVVGYLTIGDYKALGMFISLAIITSYFTKNFIIIFGVAIFGANILLANNVVEGFRKIKKKKKEEEEDEDEEGGERIDYAATKDAAYNNLEKMLGPRGVKGLTADASKLMGQQEKMMKNLETFAPLLTKAEKMMGQFSGLSGSLGNVDGLLGKLAEAKPQEGGKKKK